MEHDNLFQSEQTSAENYAAAARKLALLYNIFTEVPLAEEIIRVWILVMRSAREVDSMYDSLPVDIGRSDFIPALLSLIEGGGGLPGCPHTSALSRFLVGKDDLRHDFLVRLRILFRNAEKVRTSSSTTNLARARMMEGRDLARLLLLFVEPNKKTRRVILDIAAIGNVADLVADLTKDVRLGVISTMQSGLLTRLGLMSSLIMPSVRTLGELGVRQMYRFLPAIKVVLQGRASDKP